MPDLFGMKQLGRSTVGGRFYATPNERVEAGAIYVPNESSPLFGVAEYPVEAGALGAFTTEGTFVFDKPGDWIDAVGRKVFFRPSTGEIVNQDIKGDVLIGFQILANIPNEKLGVVLTQGEISVVILVTSTADFGAGSLRQAIADAQDGDVILFDDDIFPSNQTTSILLSSHVSINKQLTIDAGATVTPRVALDAQNNSRCLYLQTAAGGTLRGLLFCNASNSSNGGAIYCAATNPITFTQCRFSNNQGNTGGGLSTTVAATLTFDACTFSDNTANSNGGAIYGGNGATLTFDACTFSGNTSETDNSRRGVLGIGSCAVIATDTTFDALFIYGTGSITITGGVTTTAELIAPAGLVVTIQDGAALTVTTTATIDAATFTSVGRGYLALTTGLDASAATLNNVVLCSYGAGLESFEISADGASWTAQDLTTPILIERRVSDATWTTLSSVATGGTYSDSFDVGTTARAFDGVRFFVASLDAYWQVNASVAANANGGGGTGSGSPSWTVENKTITPNVGG